MFYNGTFVRLARVRPCLYRGAMPTKPEGKKSLEEVVRLLCEYVEHMSEEEKAELRCELLNGTEVPPHLRWEN
jgi:hypothetical protein